MPIPQNGQTHSNIVGKLPTDCLSVFGLFMKLALKGLIKVMIVYGANDSSSREWLLRESELTLSKAISASHTVEETHKHAREIL